MHTPPMTKKHPQWLKSLAASLLLISMMLISPLITAAPLPANQAFILQGITRDAQTIIARISIAPNYYIYQSSLRVIAKDPKTTEIGVPITPYDTTLLNTPLGQFQVYQGTLSTVVPVIEHASSAVDLLVHYQGCSHDGYCYPPMTKAINLDLAGPYNIPFQATDVMPTPIKISATSDHILSTKSPSLFSKHNTAITLLIFLGLGILIACTPCILPMIPILSSIIIGHHQQKNTKTAFFLSLAYVFGIAITYAAIGVVFGLMGSNIQTALQKPWIITIFSAIFIAMALSLFGLYTIQLPQALRQRLNKINEQQASHHSYIGSFFMGILSTLIVSPCVTAPLVGALTYISNQGSMLFGGLALFSLGIGIGIPLLIIATLGHKYIPKSGPWMNTVQGMLGILLVGVAIVMLARILPAHIILLLWGALAIGSGVACISLIKISKKIGLFISRTLAILLCLYGTLLIVGGSLGNTSLWQPFNSTKKEGGVHFIYAHTRAELFKQLATAKQQKQPVLIDFYANWCISCKILDKTIFGDADIIKKLKHYRLIRIDVTEQSIEEKALQHQLGVIAPPTIIFYNAQGIEEKNNRIVGEVSKKEFLKTIF